jgi:ATPase family associated with various cellular activities (AAA)
VQIIVEGPDGCGKTEIAHALAGALNLPYFKVDSERKNWAEDTFKHSLWFDYVLPQFLAQTQIMGYVSDRGYPSEVVYPQVFGRTTNEEMLRKTDDLFADLGDTVIVLALRRDYKGSRPDDLVPEEKLLDLHYHYLEFARDFTKCDVVLIYVDDFKNDLTFQIPVLVRAIDGIMECSGLTKQIVTVTP